MTAARLRQGSARRTRAVATDGAGFSVTVVMQTETEFRIVAKRNRNSGSATAYRKAQTCRISPLTFVSVQRPEEGALSDDLRGISGPPLDRLDPALRGAVHRRARRLDRERRPAEHRHRARL